MTTYHYFLTYPANLGPISVNELMQIINSKKMASFLHTEKQILINDHYLPTLIFGKKLGDKLMFI